MRTHWLALILFCAGPAQAQFVKNTGIVVVNSADITVNGDWDNLGSFTNNGTITTSENWTAGGGYNQNGTGGFVLTNAATRQFNHNGQYVASLTKNGSGNTQVNNRLTITNKLQLQNGLLTMTGVNDTLVVNANALVTTTATSGVVGKVTHYGTGDLLFPMSYSGNNVPITIYQVQGNNPRVTVSVQNAPGGYTINGATNSLIGFPYAWKSQVVRGDTASYVEVQYPTSLPTTANPIVARSIDPTHYATMGLLAVSTAGGVTKIKSEVQGLKGLFTVAQGVKQPQTITFGTLNAVTFGVAPFNLAASSSSNLPVTYSSSNPLVATINGSTVTITGAGNTTISASQSGDPTYLAAPIVNQGLTVAKANQIISFGPIAAKTLGDAPFSLAATANSGLPVQYTSSAPTKLTISGNVATIVAAGSATINADQPGNGNYNAATLVPQTFCINPAKPVITLSSANTESPVLTSSNPSGNQWFMDGTLIPGATSPSLNLTSPGLYTVQSTVETCVSAMSAEEAIVVTGDVNLPEGTDLVLFPNPVHNELFIDFKGFDRQKPIDVVIYDNTGKVIGRFIGSGQTRSVVDVRTYSLGIYILRAAQSERLIQKTFIKQ